jgi:hypothetical protein
MPNDDSGIFLVMEEARRLLQRQEADLDTLRGQVATLLAGSSIVAAVFGAALPSQRSHVAVVFAFAALGFFVATVFVCLYILRRWDWAFSHKLGAALTKLKEDPPQVCCIGGGSCPAVRVTA